MIEHLTPAERRNVIRLCQDRKAHGAAMVAATVDLAAAQDRSPGYVGAIVTLLKSWSRHRGRAWSPGGEAARKA